MDVQRPKPGRPSRAARVWGGLFGLFFGALIGFCAGCPYGLPYSILIALFFSGAMAADGARVGGGIWWSIVQAFFYI